MQVKNLRVLVGIFLLATIVGCDSKNNSNNNANDDAAIMNGEASIPTSMEPTALPTEDQSAAAYSSFVVAGNNTATTNNGSTAPMGNQISSQVNDATNSVNQQAQDVTNTLNNDAGNILNDDSANILSNDAANTLNNDVANPLTDDSNASLGTDIQNSQSTTQDAVDSLQQGDSNNLAMPTEPLSTPPTSTQDPTSSSTSSTTTPEDAGNSGTWSNQPQLPDTDSTLDAAITEPTVDQLWPNSSGTPAQPSDAAATDDTASAESPSQYSAVGLPAMDDIRSLPIPVTLYGKG